MNFIFVIRCHVKKSSRHCPLIYERVCFKNGDMNYGEIKLTDFLEANFWIFVRQKKQALMKQMLAPIVSKFSDLLRSMSTETDEKKQLEYANCLSHAMAFAR